jgi:hypothetical protein
MRGTVAKRLRKRAAAMTQEAGIGSRLISRVMRTITRKDSGGKIVDRQERVTVRYVGFVRAYRNLKAAHRRRA